MPASLQKSVKVYLRTAISTGYGGSGVGLSIINRIAEAHDWNITLTESPEGGARFEFSHAAEQ